MFAERRPHVECVVHQNGGHVELTHLERPVQTLQRRALSLMGRVQRI